jgi:undecaprenyl-diphosphatase
MLGLRTISFLPNLLSIPMYRFLIILAILVASREGLADSSGPLGIDHRLAYDQSGIWARKNQIAVEYGSALLLIGDALYEGDDNRIGMTDWKAVDSMLFTDISATAAKMVFRRERPRDGNDPNAFFNNSKDKSFPSGEMAHITAIVTPFIMEYQKDTPSVWLLAALPAYVGVARMKAQAHWQTDILAGGALGAGIGYLSFKRDQPWTIGVLPGGLEIGYKARF